MLLIALTVLLVAAWWVFVTAADGPGSGESGGPATRAVLAATGASGQIVLTCAWLGAAGLLTIPAVSGASLAVAALLIGLFLRSSSRRDRLAAALRSDLGAVLPALRASVGWETAIFAAFLLFAGVWLATAVVFYPPRGVDDLVYHLPPLYQAVQDHRFSILPIELRKFFAFPFNGEMPVLWTGLLTGSARWVDGTQLVFAALGIGAVFALARALGVRHRGALLAAALFGTMPVVLLQATSNYIDVTVNVWTLGAAVALLAYERSGSRAALLVGGLATGLVLGSKYQAIPFAAFFAAFAGAAALRRGLRGPSLARAGLIFAVPAAGAGGIWYLRNWVMFHNPFYPLPVTVFGTTLFAGDWPQGASVMSALLKDPVDALRIAVWDPGLRTFNGGLGFLFWGLALAAWTRLFVMRARGTTSEDVAPPVSGAGRWSRPWFSGAVLALGLVPVGIATFLLTPFDDLALTARYVLAVGGVAFVALAWTIQQAERSRAGAATGMRAVCVLAGGLALVVAAGSNRPLLDLSYAAAETPEVRAQGEQRYLQQGLRALSLMAEGWAPLDALTRGGAGLTVYQAADYKIFWTAPTFGTDLQNRIWNFLGPADREKTVPDAFFFHQPSHAPLYIGKEISRETVAADPGYELVASNGDDVTTLYVARRVLAEKGRRQHLVEYYRTLRPGLVRETAPAAEAVREGSVLFATFPLAAAFLVHEAEGRLKAELVPLTSRELQAEAARRADRPIYTLGVTLDGRRASVVRDIDVMGVKVSLVLNEPAGGAEPAMGSGGGASR